MSRLAQAVARRQFVIGTVVSSTCPLVTEAISVSDMDFIFIDTEHAPIDARLALSMAQSVRGRCLSIIRTSGHGKSAIEQALDAGCDGIVVPQVNSADIARAVVAAAKYPPLGRRGV